MRSGWWATALGVAWTLSACSGQIAPDGNASSDSVASGGSGSLDGEGSGGTPSGGAPDTSGSGGGAPLGSGGTASGGKSGTGGADMVLLPGGSFLMGSGDGNTSTPQHERTLEGFAIDRTEVTAGAYDRCVLAEACTPADPTGLGVNPGVPGFENYPANYVTLKQAEVYCAWMRKRLPTEAEWEYAAGGLQGLEYPWGDGAPGGCIVGFLNPQPEDADQDHGCAVGQFAENENGLWDMGGGVYEYTSSPYCNYSASTETGYVSGCQSDSFALRDGAFTSVAKELARVANRQPIPEDFTHQAIGFRCAADASN